MKNDYIIEMRNITKNFPGIIANDNISFELKRGEIHALLGENGAGKSTLMSVLFGMYKPDEGHIYLNGREVEIQSPNDANRLGIGMVHQHFKLVEVFSVLDNIIMGMEPTKGIKEFDETLTKEARHKSLYKFEYEAVINIKQDIKIAKHNKDKSSMDELKSSLKAAKLVLKKKKLESKAIIKDEVEGYKKKYIEDREILKQKYHNDSSNQTYKEELKQIKTKYKILTKNNNVSKITNKVMTGIGAIDRKKTKDEILNLSKKYELMVDLDKKIEDTTVGMQQRTEILKMLYRKNDILIFDEPTAVLTPQEINQLMITMKNLAKEGKSIIFITHKLDEIMSVCDRVTVLRRGKKISTHYVKDTDKHKLTKLMIGRDVDFTIDKKETTIGENFLMVQNLTVVSDISKKHVVNNVSFKVNRGEIVCIAGIDGNGQSELGYVISGLIKPKQGKIYLNYVDISNKSIRFRNDNGLSHIPEDRQKYGFIMEDSLEDNLALKKYHLKPFQNKGMINRKSIRELANSLIGVYDIRCGQGAKTPMGSMSGGNQQKAIIAREIDKNSDLLLSIQTVRGLDVGAVQFAHETLIKERNKGKGILIISFDLDEVMSVSDRILIMYEGQIVKNVLTKDITVEELGLYMAGVKKDELEPVDFSPKEYEIIQLKKETEYGK